MRLGVHVDCTMAEVGIMVDWIDRLHHSRDIVEGGGQALKCHLDEISRCST